MRVCRLAAATALLILSSVPRASAEPKTLEELLDTLAPLLANIETYSSDLAMTMNMGSMTMNLDGKVLGKGAKSESQFKLDMLGQTIATRTVTDGSGIAWMDMDMMGQRVVMKMDIEALTAQGNKMMGNPMSGMMGGNNTQDPTRIIEQMNMTFDLSPVGIEDLNGTPVYVVAGNLRDETYAQMDLGDDANAMLAGVMGIMSGARVYVGVEDGFPRKMEMLGESGTPTMTMAYNNVVLNEPIDDSKFEYSPPDGVDVMDMTDTMQAQLAGTGNGEDVQSGYNAKLHVGEAAPEFEAPALDGGKPIVLSDYRGKVVLIDFWASWCGPCIAEMPNVIDAYQTFRARGFEIVGVNLDDAKSDVSDFLAEHTGMMWRQVFDGKGWDSDVGVLYGVDAIPFTLLLDKEGTIVARDLRGDALKEEISKLLPE